MSQKKHIIDVQRCKSCGLCVDACPKKVLGIGSKINAQGYNYVEQVHPELCINCDICGIVCPDIAIGVIKIEG